MSQKVSIGLLNMNGFVPLQVTAVEKDCVNVVVLGGNHKAELTSTL
jgi:hypothetical protein